MIADTDVGALTYFFTGYMNIIIIAMCAASIGYSIFSECRSYRKARGGRRERDMFVSLVVLCGAAVLYWSLSLMDDPRAATFPRVIIVIMGGLSVVLLLQSALFGRKTDKPALQSSSVEDKQTNSKSSFPWGTLIACFVMIVIYFAAMERLGFYLSDSCFFWQ